MQHLCRRKRAADAAGLPFRYRSYYQDTETGFYYLQSRYYDPAIGRFINADGYVSTGQDFIGCNMFAYCGNNPINASDATGMLFLFDDAVLLAACFVVAVVAVVVVVYSPPVREAIYGMADALADVLLDVFESIENTIDNVMDARTKGKENMRDSGLSELSDEEIQQRAKDKSLPTQERRRYQTEEKARKLRNKSRRDELY